jgi:hypothetical protein
MNEIIFWTGIWPKWKTRPIGVYQLAFWLRSNNVECQVIDFCQWLTADEIIDFTIKFLSPKTKFIGISTSFWGGDTVPKNINDAIKKLKIINPDLKIIMGGARSDSKNIKKLADITIVGEGEDKLLELIKGHNIFRKFNITELNHRFSSKDCIIDNEVLPIELGRGCIFKCKFCGHSNLGKEKHTYQRPIQEIEAEISYNYETFKTTNYLFLDDTVNEDIDKVKNLSLIPKNTGVDINWTGYLRADLLWRYSESPELLLKSGLKSCFFGIETFHPYASLSIGKGWSSKHGKEFLKFLYSDLWKKEVSIWNNFIVGLPGESPESINNTVEWCLENPMGIHKFVGLNLYNNRTDSGSRSEFSKNYHKYGYKIDYLGNWENEFFDGNSCNLLVNNINEKLLSVNTLASWKLFDLLSCDNNINNIKTIPEKFYNNNAHMRFKIFLLKYKEKLNSL